MFRTKLLLAVLALMAIVAAGVSSTYAGLIATPASATVTDISAGFTAISSSIGTGAASAQPTASIYDAISDLTSATATGSTPHTYIGQAFNVTGAGGATPQVTSMKVGLFILGAQTYTDVQGRVQFWGTFDPTATGATSVFSNPVGGLLAFDLGPVTTTGNAALFINVSFPTPITLPGTTNLGFAVNYQTSSDGSPVADDTNVTAAMRAPTGTLPIPIGQNDTVGGVFYRNASGRTDFDFNANDARSLSGQTLADDGIAFQLTAVAVPEPASAGLLGIGALGLLARRRRSPRRTGSV
jgi:PEP-CTERM motif